MVSVPRCVQRPASNPPQQVAVCAVTSGEPALCNPLLPQAGCAAILRHLVRVAGAAVNPGVPYFAGDHRQHQADGVHRGSNVIQSRSPDCGMGIELAEPGIHRGNLIHGIGAAVVIAHFHVHRDTGARNLEDAAVIVTMIDDRDGLAAGSRHRRGLERQAVCSPR